MNPRLRRFAPVAGALLLGALGYLLFGNGPQTPAPRDGDQAAWALPTQTPPDLKAAAALWESRPPWGADAATDAEEAEAAAIAEAAARPVAVGVVVADDGSLEALFQIADEPLLRLREGEALPTGGQVTGITRAGVAWTDAKGKAMQRELFVDPAPASNQAAASPARNTGSRNTGSRATGSRQSERERPAKRERPPQRAGQPEPRKRPTR